MPKTIPQILDLGSSTSSVNSFASTGDTARLASTSSTSLVGGDHPSKVTTSHLLQHRPKKRKRAPVIQDEDANIVGLSESTQRQLEISKQSLYDVIDRVLKNQPLGHSLSFFYGRVEAICRYKHEEQKKLADYLFEKLDAFFEDTIERPFSGHKFPREDKKYTPNIEDDLFALSVCERVLEDWKIWNTIVMKLSQVFAYLEKNYLQPHHSRKSIATYGESKFADTYFTVKRDEQGNIKNDDVIHETTKTTNYGAVVVELYIFVTLLYYRAKYWEATEKDIVNRSRAAFKDTTALTERLIAKSETWSQLFPITTVILQFDTLPDREYVGWFCDEKFQNAIELKKRFMILDDEIALYKSCGKEKDYVDHLATSLIFLLVFKEDFNDLVLNDFGQLIESPEEMKMLNKMCFGIEGQLAINGEEKIKYVWRQYCTKIFIEAIEMYQSNAIDLLMYPNALLYIDPILKGLQEKVTYYYDENISLKYLPDACFNGVVNLSKYNTYMIQQLCKLCDLYFKSKLTILVKSVSALWKLVSNCYIELSNQDDFLTVYKKDASRRLLLGKTSNLKEEQAFAKLLKDFGKKTDASSSLESMFEDLKSSSSVYSKLVKVPDFEFEPLILEKSVWPEIPSQDYSSVQLPTEFTTVLENFGQAFHEADDRNGRKRLDWSNYKLHHLTIAGHFANGEKSITANMLQAMVILLFNEAETFTLQEITQKTKMDPALLQAVLNTMTTGKHKILKQEGNVIKFNRAFKDKSKSIKLPIVKETALDLSSSRGTSIDKEVIEAIEKNRTEEFKSVIVRIMKQAKTLQMTNLLNQSIEILQKRRPVSIIDLKAVIEKLITDEFLRRRNRDTIEYIA